MRWCSDSHQHQRILSDKQLPIKRCLPNVVFHRCMTVDPWGLRSWLDVTVCPTHAFMTSITLAASRDAALPSYRILRVSVHHLVPKPLQVSRCGRRAPSKQGPTACQALNGTKQQAAIPAMFVRKTIDYSMSAHQHSCWPSKIWLFSCWRQRNATFSQPISCNECGCCTLL